jgi:lysophospholipase
MIMFKYTLIILILVGFMTKINANNFTTESQLTTRYSNEIAQFWLQGEFSSFNGVNDKRINYALFNHNKTDINTANHTNRKCLIISSGRSEGYLKYKELSFDLFNLGFNVFLMDHRGQGISARLLENPHKGYVEDFQYYVDDFASFIEKAVKPYCNVNGETQKPYLLAHSMGSAIAARYLQDYPNNIQAAVLSSPMFGFNSGPIPGIIAEPLVKVTNQINQIVSDTPWYFFGQKDYTPKADDPTSFTDNPLMHSELRFRQFIQLYQKEPKLQLGGITVKWLSESITALETLFNNIDKITIPTLVIQAGADTIVSNEAQYDFCQQLHQHYPYSCPEGKPLVIEGAYHELFFESDIYRQQALTAAVEWFKQY